jgi:hypothetical protein
VEIVVVSHLNDFILEVYPAMLIPETESIALLPGPLTNQAPRPILPTLIRSTDVLRADDRRHKNTARSITEHFSHGYWW